MNDPTDSTVLLVEEAVEYELLRDYFGLDDGDLSDPRVLETTNRGKDATLVSYKVDGGIQGYSDARLDFRVYDKSNDLYKSEAVLTDYDNDGEITQTATYTVRNGSVQEALYDR